MTGARGHANTIAGGHLPRLIAWEVTRSCMLACKHCRAAAQPAPYPDELTTPEAFRLLDNIASFAKPILILTGGEPMLRPDIYQIAAYAQRLGLTVVMAPCGALIDEASAARIVAAGIRRISISLDGVSAESHDAFRGTPGAFAASLSGIAAAKRAGLDFQINTTVTRHNLDELPAILDLSVELGASAFNPFLLVPTGRGRQLADQEISPDDYERTLQWLARQQQRDDILIRVTCAPHYQRVLRQLGLHRGQARPAKGCMGGQSFAFISHVGKAQICGFLDVECGDVRHEGFDFQKIWETSEIFRQMRDPSGYGGRCGRCEFARVCGGCRARAYAVTGDYLAEEPFCTYQPAGSGRDPNPGAELDELDREILSIIQTEFPVARRPYDVLGRRLSAEGPEVLERVRRLAEAGIIRRLGAVFDSRSLGYASTLVAGRIPPERLDEVAAMVNELPGVTHNYAREHAWNLWFTLTAESQERLAEIVDGLKRRTGVDDCRLLPALSVYKMRVHFDLTGRPAAATAPAKKTAATPQQLSPDQKDVVRLLQETLPLVAEPFDEVAARLGRPVEQVLGQVEQWLGEGVIRRLGAVVRHRRLGFAANGMAVFRVPPDRVDDAGRALAEIPDVSHCYRRPPLPGSDRNLYAMFHGRAEDQVRAVVDEAAGRLGVSDYEVLFSTTEYKKTSMRYFEAPSD